MRIGTSVLLAVVFSACATQPRNAASVSFVTDEADAVLKILDKRAHNQAITATDWSDVFRAEGYVRLKAREHAMGRTFEDDAFRDFVMRNDLLARRDVLRATLTEWFTMDVREAAHFASVYLPANAKIAAKVYPVIKPATNSFVFDLQRDPAIFVYMEPLPKDTLQGIVAHELHHVGYASSCAQPEPASLPDLHQWLSAFGEGLATMAAAGGPGRQPRIKPEPLARWYHETQQLPANFDAAQSFLQSVARGELKGDAQQRKGMELFGIVGPWYTVGWHMAEIIERELGRAAAISAFCDQSTLLQTYNKAAQKREERTGEKQLLWSDELVHAFDAH
jgi:hypothetical protein